MALMILFDTSSRNIGIIVCAPLRRSGVFHLLGGENVVVSVYMGDMFLSNTFAIEPQNPIMQDFKKDLS